MHMLCLLHRKADEKISPSVFKMIITHMALTLELIAGQHIIAKRCLSLACWLSFGSLLIIFNSFHQPANKLIVHVITLAFVSYFYDHIYFARFLEIVVLMSCAFSFLGLPLSKSEKMNSIPSFQF